MEICFGKHKEANISYGEREHCELPLGSVNGRLLATGKPVKIVNGYLVESWEDLQSIEGE